MPVADVAEALERWEADGKRSAVATLVEVRGSAPRDPGARFALSSDGEIAGSVSSGCVEGDLHERLAALLDGRAEPALVRYGISDEQALNVGLSCGGTIDVWTDLHQADPAWRAAVESGSDRHWVLVSSLAHGDDRRLWVGEKGSAGSLGDVASNEAAARVANSLLGHDGVDLFELPDGRLAFAESSAPRPPLYIVGATPIGEALCRYAAHAGYRVRVIEPRTAFADPSRFPDAEVVSTRWPDDALTELGLDRFADVVVLTHDAKLDIPALRTALELGARYIGLLGGRRTQESRRETLEAEGVPAARLADIHGPVGLDIGASTPPEIAISILAELIAVRRAGPAAG